MRGRVLTNIWQMKWFTFWDALTRQRTDLPGIVQRDGWGVGPGKLRGVPNYREFHRINEIDHTGVSE